jgi:acetolactate synthase-1/2/3 large subunit
MKYSDQVIDWLAEDGYTHCFFVAGGNIMHLLDSVRSKLVCVPFINEIGAAIAAEYFTEASDHSRRKAFVLVTAGPGLTNTITAMASAWAESRELLVIGGQVKSSDLAKSQLRQKGIQEVDGISITKSFTKARLQVSAPVSKGVFLDVIRQGSAPRKGPVFIEITLDAQGATGILDESLSPAGAVAAKLSNSSELKSTLDLLLESQRPIFLIGSGLARDSALALSERLDSVGVPVMLTWNAADRFPSNYRLNFGRPNTWGQRYSNVLLQQADLVIAVGTRLGLQQTGFAWEEFVPNGKVVHVDIDLSELEKEHPKKELRIQADAGTFLQQLLSNEVVFPDFSDWLTFCEDVRKLLPLSEQVNETSSPYVNPYELMLEISDVAQEGDLIIPSSSGSSFTVAMQTFKLKAKQKMISNKGLASMGYGLSGSIGASLSDSNATTWLFEGDGGFAQNLQELGTVAAQKLNLKMFVLENGGYASIRMTQKNYFDGAWVGCDAATGLGLPDLKKLSDTYNIPHIKLSAVLEERLGQLRWVSSHVGPLLVEVPIDPEQKYFPKISSKVTASGAMQSNPLHLMDPKLKSDVEDSVFRYIKKKVSET